jgi:hypothetical protein
MKITNLIFACMFTFVLSITAQVTPIPPKTNSFGNKHTNVTTSISNSTSVSNSDDSYKFTSRFQKSKRVKIQELLSKRLKGYGLKVSGKNYVWSEKRNGSLVFECKLTNRTMKLFLYKNEVPNSAYKKVKALGVELQKLITKHSNTGYGYRSVNSAKEDVRRAERELKRAKERLKIVERGNN